MTESNPADRSKLGTKRQVLTDKNGIPLSVVISSASTHDVKAVTDVVDYAVVRRPPPTVSATKNRIIKQHLCLDKAYYSRMVKQEIIKRGYIPHIPYKRKRGQKKEAVCKKKGHSAKNKRWVVERTNSWHNRFRKLFTRHEKKAENYLGLVQLSSGIIIYRKIILG
jgi:transposase